MFLKRKSLANSWLIFIVVFSLILILSADLYFLPKLKYYTESILFKILLEPWLIFIFLIAATLAYYINFKFICNNLYIDDSSKNAVPTEGIFDKMAILFGIKGELVVIECKLILRNKRPKQMLLFAYVYLFIGLLFIKQESVSENNIGLLFLGAIALTGISITTYGQFLFSWQSSHFQGLLSNNLNFKDVLKSKFIILRILSIYAFIISLLYGLIHYKIIFLLLSSIIFNLGFHTPFICIFALYNYKGIDLGKNAYLNYQGTSSIQWLYFYLLLFCGLLIYLPFSLLGSPWYGVIAIGIFGLVSLMLNNWWIKILMRLFRINKYKIISGFLEK